MSKIQNLYDERAKVKSSMDGILKIAEDSETGLTGEQELQFDKAFDDFEKFSGDISRMEKLAKINASFEDGKGEFVEAQKSADKPKYADVFEKQFRGADSLSPEEKAVLKEGLDVSSRAQSTTVGAGGYSIPVDTEASIYKYMTHFGPFANDTSPFDVMRTNGGNVFYLPQNDDTGNSGRLLTEAGDASSATTDLTFTRKQLDAYKYTSDLIKVNSELIQDSGVNFEAFLAEQLGERLGRIFNTHLTTGTGSNQPEGIVIGASSGYTAASETAVTQAEITELMFSVDKAYRNNNSRWMFHDGILKDIMKLDTSTSNYSQPLWQPSFAAGQPDTILGHQYLINNDMASAVATGEKVMLFGDMKKFKIRIVNGIVLKVLQERYAELDQVAWVGFSRFDSVVADSTAIKYLQAAT